MTKIAINGAAGRMGLRLVELIHRDPELKIVSAVENDGHSKIGIDVGLLAGTGELGIPINNRISTDAEVVIDFSKPAGARQAIDFCLANKKPLVMATTGLEEPTVSRLKESAHQIPVVWAPSMSLAVNLTMKLVEMAGTALRNHDSGVDVEIIERHHRFKADSPSGTALKFGEIVALAMGQTDQRHGREGMIGERPQTEIGYHAIRAGDNPGQHTILFGMLGETIELKVAASNRDCYANGAIAAAKFVVKQGAGLYNMYDVLGV